MVAFVIDKVRPAERRSTTRRQPTVGTVCRLVLEDGTALPGLVWNVSAGGVSILLARRLETGKEFEGELIAAQGQRRIHARLRVAHVMPLRTGDFAIGCQFVRPLAAGELTSLIAP